ncbi:hypothetical protein ACLNGM_18410 [Aureimonas phyllosphaerae]|uniref:hypothetical protein n=1 Tax=Aureimonas phyllosphaerae TaxID=1166078 RepID=UPI003A5C0136
MKSLFAIGASALVMGLASIGGAQAQAVLPTIDAAINSNLVNLQASFGNGNWVNEAVNIGAINGAVVLGQAGVETITNVDLPRVGLNIQGAGAAGATVVPAVAAIAGAAEIGLDVNLGQVDTVVRTTGGIVNRAAIETTVLGAVNTGDIASVGSASANRASQSTTIATGTVTNSVTAAASAAANTSNTASNSAASETILASVTGPSSTVTNSLEQLYNGPLQDVYANNRAFNLGTINGAVAAVANSMDLNGLTTTVLGAVNTGTISMGYSGAAFQDVPAAVANTVSTQITGQ